MYSLTLFHSQFDNKTEKIINFQSWDEFVNLLRGLSERPLAGKREAQLISPAMYELGTTRANRNVVEWGHWACVDVDDYEGTIDDIISKFSEYNTVVYSTASSTIVQPKFRIVFDLDRRVASEELRHFWYAINKELGELGDAQTKDSSRMYYIPAHYTGSNNFFHTTTGSPMAVSRLLREHPYSAPTGNSLLDKLPEEMRERVIQHRKDSLDNTDITWSGYGDCPFVPRKMALEYKSISGTGWYHAMFKLMIAIASNAIRQKYPITASQIALLCKEIDRETGNWYENRPIEREAQSALAWAYANVYEE